MDKVIQGKENNLRSQDKEMERSRMWRLGHPEVVLRRSTLYVGKSRPSGRKRSVEMFSLSRGGVRMV
jgi:hypothetical protein